MLKEKEKAKIESLLNNPPLKPKNQALPKELVKVVNEGNKFNTFKTTQNNLANAISNNLKLKTILNPITASPSKITLKKEIDIFHSPTLEITNAKAQPFENAFLPTSVHAQKPIKALYKISKLNKNLKPFKKNTLEPRSNKMSSRASVSGITSNSTKTNHGQEFHPPITVSSLPPLKEKARLHRIKRQNEFDYNVIPLHKRKKLIAKIMEFNQKQFSHYNSNFNNTENLLIQGSQQSSFSKRATSLHISQRKDQNLTTSNSDLLYQKKEQRMKKNKHLSKFLTNNSLDLRSSGGEEREIKKSPLFCQTKSKKCQVRLAKLDLGLHSEDNEIPQNRQTIKEKELQIYSLKNLKRSLLKLKKMSYDSPSIDLPQSTIAFCTKPLYKPLFETESMKQSLLVSKVSSCAPLSTVSSIHKLSTVKPIRHPKSKRRSENLSMVDLKPTKKVTKKKEEDNKTTNDLNTSLLEFGEEFDLHFQENFNEQYLSTGFKSIEGKVNIFVPSISQDGHQK